MKKFCSSSSLLSSVFNKPRASTGLLFSINNTSLSPSSLTSSTTSSTSQFLLNSISQQQTQLRFASKKSGGSTSKTKDSHSKRLGLKRRQGERVKAGEILIRQRGNSYWPGYNVLQGKDYTLHALRDGWVQFVHDEIYDRKYIVVAPRLADISKQSELQFHFEGEEPFVKDPIVRLKHGRNVANAQMSRLDREKKREEQAMEKDILPIKRIPGTQIHKIPKIINHQVKYVEDTANFKCKSNLKTHRILPISEPSRENCA